MDGQPHTDTGSPTRGGFVAGMLAALPVLLAVGPFGMIFGILGTAAGLDLAQTMAMTVVVIAGASQLAALQLMTDQAPALICILTGAVVNLRMAMYSASIATYWRGVPMRWRFPAAFVLHDQAYALSVARYRARPGEGPGARLGFYMGVGVLTCTVWTIMTWVGATHGAALIPPEKIDFMVPVTFIAIVAPMIRGRANVAAAVVAAGLALGFAWLPFGLGLLVAAAGGIATGLVVGGRA